MRIPLRGLIRGAVGGLAAYGRGRHQGEVDRIERERQARHRMLQEQLMQAQIAGARQKPAIDPLSPEGVTATVETAKRKAQAEAEADASNAAEYVRRYPDLAGFTPSEQLRLGRTRDAATVQQPARDAAADRDAANAKRQMTSQLRDDFNKEIAVSDGNRVAGAIRKMRVGASAQTAAGDMGLIFSYMRLLDPASTVREGEYATAQNAASVPDQVRNLYNKAVDGQFLTPQQRGNFVAQGNQIAQQQQQLVQGQMDRYSQIAERNGINAADIVFDPFASSGRAAPRFGRFRKRKGR